MKDLRDIEAAWSYSDRQGTKLESYTLRAVSPDSSYQKILQAHFSLNMYKMMVIIINLLRVFVKKSLQPRKHKTFV